MESSMNVKYGSQVYNYLNNEIKESPVINGRYIFDSLRERTMQMAQEEEYFDPSIVKGRFGNVLCPIDTAVVFNKGKKYLHANSVSLHAPNNHDVKLSSHIITQAPLLDDFETFWGVALENTNFIIDLTNARDNSDCYYPMEVGQEIKYENVSVKNISNMQLPGEFYQFTIHNYEVSNSTGSRIITRINYLGWIDGHPTGLEDLVKIMQLCDAFKIDLSIIHCLAGVGRAGTLIVAMALRELYKKGLLNNKVEDTKKLILEAREQRGPGTVQTPRHIDLLLQFYDRLINHGPIDSNENLSGYIQKFNAGCSENINLGGVRKRAEKPDLASDRNKVRKYNENGAALPANFSQLCRSPSPELSENNFKCNIPVVDELALARIYENTIRTNEGANLDNAREAIKHYSLAAQQGNNEANFKVSYLKAFYFKDISSAEKVACCYKDLKKAFALHKYAADKGNIDALYNLGVCYELGRGTNINKDEAMKCYKLVANRLNASLKSSS